MQHRTEHQGLWETILLDVNHRRLLAFRRELSGRIHLVAPGLRQLLQGAYRSMEGSHRPPLHRWQGLSATHFIRYLVVYKSFHRLPAFILFLSRPTRQTILTLRSTSDRTSIATHGPTAYLPYFRPQHQDVGQRRQGFRLDEQG